MFIKKDLIKYWPEMRSLTIAKMVMLNLTAIDAIRSLKEEFVFGPNDAKLIYSFVTDGLELDNKTAHEISYKDEIVMEYHDELKWSNLANDQYPYRSIG